MRFFGKKKFQHIFHRKFHVLTSLSQKSLQINKQLSKLPENPFQSQWFHINWLSTRDKSTKLTFFRMLHIQTVRNSFLISRDVHSTNFPFLFLIIYLSTQQWINSSRAITLNSDFLHSMLFCCCCHFFCLIIQLHQFRSVCAYLLLLLFSIKILSRFFIVFPLFFHSLSSSFLRISFVSCPKGICFVLGLFLSISVVYVNMVVFVFEYRTTFVWLCPRLCG